MLFIGIAIPIIGFSQENTTNTDSISKSQFETVFEKSKGTKTATYEQTILYYQNLAKVFPEIKVEKMGTTDSGHPLHLVIFDAKKIFILKDTIRSKLLINNGIHPGESDGIDASMQLLRDIAFDKNLKEKYKNILICIIPIYNIGGSLNRNSNSRVNQNGPISYGFRGNSLNYDLNRDFIKNDSQNAKSFAKIFHEVNPIVFVDTHVSNGADYQYTVTQLFTQHNKLSGKISDYLYYKMIPELEEKLTEKGIINAPYVNVFNKDPKNGFTQFFDSPRYSTGYTSLFNTLGLTVETHMLKPYKERVKATYAILEEVIDFTSTYGRSLNNIRKGSADETLSKKTYPIHWKIDSTRIKTIDFKGFEREIITSKVTGQQRVKYNREKPYTQEVDFYDHYKPTKEIVIPNFYIVPKHLTNVIELLKLNTIKMHPLKKDISILVESYEIKKYETVKMPYEGHYLHMNTEVIATHRQQKFEAGDFLISTQQPGIKYIIETLEPEAKDSFFNWNFFDIILQQKEHFSPYIFEDLAKTILDDNKDLRSKFEQKKAQDSLFSKNSYEQLNFIYMNSKYAEKEFLQYPIYRILK
jgi:hypothetical protein